MKRPTFPVSGGPFLGAPQSVRSISATVAASLAPTVVAAGFLFGPVVYAVIGISVATALAVEAAFGAVRGQPTVADGTAVLTGLFVALGMPPGVPLFVPALASAFAVGVVKGCFGGLGSNWMNPALAGIAFAHANWPQAMGAWAMPRVLTGVEGLSGATPLGFVRASAQAAGGSAVQLLKSGGYPGSPFASGITDFLNGLVFDRLGARLPDGYVDMLLGVRPGCIGETAVLALLAGSVVLLVARVVRWQIPAVAFLVFAVLTRLFGEPSAAPFEGDILFALSTGSVVLVFFYMATDPVTSPVSFLASLAYAALVGGLAFAFRRFGTGSEGTAYAVLIANCLVPLLEKAMPARDQGRAAA